MIIKEIHIEKFRGFANVHFTLGEHLTVIAGQNGTQKTTILGMLSQPFSISDKHPMYGEKPLCGGNYKSGFADKFKLSEHYDMPKSHEWTLKFTDPDQEDYTVESITRTGSPLPRFWKKGDRTKGSGYIQFPVIYLSLSRLLPIGEDEYLESSGDVELTESELRFFKKWHDKILIITNGAIENVNYLASKQKNTLGVNTDYYDWKMNSAGQDNIGKILLAILSFKRLKESYRGSYHGGILAIDELDATLYPGSQIKLVEALNKFADDFNIQIIFTTHSLSILKYAINIQSDQKRKGQFAVVYLEKLNKKIKINECISYSLIELKLNVATGLKDVSKKVVTYTEDNEARLFLKNILKRKASKLNLINFSLSFGKYIDLVEQKAPGFLFPDSLIILDGDVRTKDKGCHRKIKKIANIILLPGGESPECILADYLYHLDDESDLWEDCEVAYSKQVCFRDYAYDDIIQDHIVAKKWFNSQLPQWGRSGSKVFTAWIKANKKEVDEFIELFDSVLNKYQVVSI